MYSNLFQKIDRDIAVQLKTLGIGEKKSQLDNFPCITLSREFGCEGIPTARHLTEILSTNEYPWVIFHRELISEISKKQEMLIDLTNTLEEEYRGYFHQYIEHLLSHKPLDLQVYKKMAKTVRLLALRGRTIILGSGAAIIAPDIPNVLHVRLQAPVKFRIERVAKMMNISESQAKEEIKSREVKRQNFIYEFTRKDLTDPKYYHLVLDNSLLNAEQISQLIFQALTIKKMLP